MAVGNLVVTLDLDGRKFHSAIQGSKAELERFAHSVTRASKHLHDVDQHTRTWGRSLRDTFIVLGLARAAVHNLVSVVTAIPRAIISSNAELERMTALMGALDNSTSDMAESAANAEETLSKLFEISSNSPFDINAVADSFVKMKSAGLEPLDGALQGLIDSVASFGGTSEQLKRASIAMQQMAGKGVISMEELRQQLGEAVPNAMQVMARATRMSMGKMVKIISEGKLDAKTALAAFARQLQIESSGSALAMSKTWVGTMNRLKNEWTKFMKVVGGKGEFGAFGVMKTALNDIVDTLANDPRVEQFGIRFGEAMVVGVEKTRELAAALMQLGAALGPALSDVISILKVLGSVAAATTKIMAEHADVVAILIKTYATFKIVGMLGAWATSLNGVTKATAAFSATQAVMMSKSSGLLALGGAMGQAAAGTNMFAKAAVGAQSAVRGLGVRAVAMGAGLKAMGAAAVAAIGPLGWLAIALMGIYEIYDRTIGKQTRYIELLAKDPKFFGAGETSALQAGVEADKEAVVQQQRLYKIAEAARDEYVADGETNRGNPGRIAEQERLMAVYEANIREAGLRISKANGQLADASAASTARIVEESARSASETVAKEFDKIQKGYKKGLLTATEEISGRADLSTEEKDEEMNRRALELERGNLDAKRALLEKYIRDREFAISIAVEGEGEKLKAGLEVYKAELEEVNGLYRENAVLIRETSKEGKALATATTILNGLNRQAAVVQEKMLEGKTEMARLQARITNGELVGAEGMVPRLKNAAAALDDLNAKYKLITQNDKSFDRLSDRVNQVTASVAGLTARAEDADNPWIQLSGAAAKAVSEAKDLITEYDTLLNGLEKQGGQESRIAQVNGEIDRLKRTIPQAELAVATRGFEGLQKAIDDYRQSTMSAADAAKFGMDRQVEYLNEFMARSAEVYGPEAVKIKEAYLATLEDQRRRAADALYRLAKDWEQATSDISTLWADGVTEMSNALTDFIVEGEADFDSFLKNIYRMIVDFMVKKMVSQFLVGMAGGWMGGAASGGSSSFNLGGASGAFSGQSFGTSASANGNVVSSRGVMSLNKFAKGGIAHRPQVAVFGEGDGAEAFVPLPDGRSIPVTMSGGAGAGSANVQVNVLNQTSQEVDAEASKPRFDGEGWVVDVVLRNMGRPGRFRESMKAAVRS